MSSDFRDKPLQPILWPGDGMLRPSNPTRSMGLDAPRPSSDQSTQSLGSKNHRWVVVSNICLFSPLFGEDEPILTIFFQMGWNHQHPPTRSYWNSQRGEVWPWNRRPGLILLLRKGLKFVLAEIYVNNMFVLDESIFNSWWMWCILIPDHSSPACMCWKSSNHKSLGYLLVKNQAIQTICHKN